jgi:hypothetical protein
MFTSWSRKLRDKSGHVSGDSRRKLSRRMPKRRPFSRLPRIEQLEDRTVPSILFMPQFGNETATDRSGLRLHNTEVYLIFWGSYWAGGMGSQEIQEIQHGLGNILQSSYLSSKLGAAQYQDINGRFFPSQGATNFVDAVIDTSSTPANGFSNGDVSQELYNLGKESLNRPSTVEGGPSVNQLVFYLTPSAPVYVVVTPPGIQASQPITGGNCNCSAYHFVSNILAFSLNPFEPDAEVMVYAWVGTDKYQSPMNTDPKAIPDPDPNGDPVVDGAIQEASHEITEAVSDPIGGFWNLPDPLSGLFSPFAAVTVSPGSRWNSSPNSQVELEDLEPDSNYTYRLGGTSAHPEGFPVQAYWSQNAAYTAPDGSSQTGAFVVPDGHSQYFLLQPQWVLKSDSTMPGPPTALSNDCNFTRHYDLVINGDQPSDPGNSLINIDTGTDGGVEVTLNGEVANFDPGTITNIVVNPGSGTNTIEVESNTMPVTINCTGTDQIVMGDAGRNLSGITGTVTVNGNGKTTLEVDDSGNASTPPQVSSYTPQSTTFTIDAAQLSRSAQAIVGGVTQTFTTTINYSGLSSLTIDGGPPVGTSPTTYHFLETSQPTPVIIKATGSDAVTLGDGTHNLSGIHSVTVNGNGNTTVEVDDRGNTVIPNPFLSYTAKSTTFTINDGQLIRSAQANAFEQVFPYFQSNFTTTLNYTDLASLTVDGGPAVGMASPPTPTPYHILNTSQVGAVVIKATGNDAVTLGDRSDNLSGISSVTVNGNGNTTVEVNDAGNTTIPAPFILYTAISTTFTITATITTTINAGQMIRSAMAEVFPNGIVPGLFPKLLTTTLSYTGLASLTVDGGPAVGPNPTPYHILSTYQTGAVAIKATGSDAVMLGDQSDNLSGINSVTVSGNGRTALELTDAGNAATPAQFAAYKPVSTSFTINAGQLTRSAVANVSIILPPPIPPLPINNYPITTTVGYSGLASLTVDGGPAIRSSSPPTPTPYHILNTSQAGAVVINATGSDAVMLGDSSHNLSAIGSAQAPGFVTVNGNGSTTVEVDDRGNSVVPPGYSVYAPQRSTQFTIDAIDAGQLIRRATARIFTSSLSSPTVARFTTTVHYSGLASLIVDSGPAVGAPTPFHILNTLGTNAVTINAHGADAVMLGDASHNLSAINSATVTGNGSTTVEVNDAGNAAIPTGYSSYTPWSTAFTIDTGRLNRVAVANVVFTGQSFPMPFPFTTTVGYSGLAGLTIDGGLAVANPPTTYQVLNTAGIISPPGSAAVTINAHGTDAVTITDANNTINGIQGTVNVNGNGNTMLNVDDSGNPVTENYTVAPTSIRRSIVIGGVYNFNTAPINYFQIANVAVHVGSAKMGLNQGVMINSLGVVGTEAGTVTDLYGNNGGGQTEFAAYPFVFNYAGPILGAVHFHGSTIGFDTVDYVDFLNSAAQTYTMSGTMTTGQMVDQGFAAVTYDGRLYDVGLETSRVGSSKVNVLSTAAVGFGTVVGANAGDVITVGSQAPNLGGTLGGLAASGRLVIRSIFPNSSASVILDDSTDTHTNKQVAFGSDSFGYWGMDGLAPQRIDVQLGTASSVQVLGGPADKVFQIHDFTNAPPITLVAEPPASTRPNQHNKLDYSLYAGDVRVNLPLGTATGFAQISGIQDVTGGNGNSLLVGDANPNILIGGTGLPAGIMSQWRGDGNANDSVGGNNGTVPTGVTFAPGVTGATGDQAFSFNGSNALVDLGHDPSLNISGTLTVSAWVNVQSLDHPKYLFADFDPTGHLSQGSLGILANGHIFWFQGNQGLANGFVEPFGATQVNLNQWYNFAVARDDNAKTITLYVNGVQDGMVSYAGIPVPALQGDKLLGGSGPGFLRDSFSGSLDEVGLFNRALSAAEIQSIYSSRGSSGRNIIIGGGGADIIRGGGGDNILIAGSTLYDQKQGALDAIFAEWTSSDSLATRMADITGGTPSGLDLNGGFVLVPAATPKHAASVFDDAAVDLLFDGTGLSWFFVHRGDDVINNGAGPSVPGDVVAFIRP